MVNEPFEPVVLAFCCNYCAYAAADLAGSMRMDYPPNVKIIRIPCTGRLDAMFLLKALENDTDGVFVAGCLEGNCHFEAGNLRARKRVGYVKRILGDIGIHPDRVEMYNLSAAMASRFVEVARGFTERIRALGPSPVRTGKGPEWRFRMVEEPEGGARTPQQPA
ncbi:MAG: hydrogenase iron-sulfur subunit [bacterium]